MTLMQRLRHLEVEMVAAGCGLLLGVVTQQEWEQRTDVLPARLARLQLP
jgi:hypothetical protein